MTSAELEASLGVTPSLRSNVLALALAMLDRAPFSAVQRSTARARFEAWAGEPGVDASALAHDLLDRESEREIIRRAISAGRPRDAMVELEAVSPVRDAWLNALGDLAHATRFEAGGQRGMAVRMIVAAIERAAFAESGVPFGNMDDPRYVEAFGRLAYLTASP